MRLPVPTRILSLAVLAVGLSGCNSMLPFTRAEPAPIAVARPTQPSTIAGADVSEQNPPRVMFDSEYDSFDPLGSTLSYALSLTGSRYRYGGTSPTEGFDCSGFVRYVFGRFGVDLPRSAREMAAILPQVEVNDRRPGDLIFFNTNGRPNSHVGIYIGEGRFVHATSMRGKTVKVSQLDDSYWRKRLNGVHRPPVQALAVSVVTDALRGQF